MNKDFEQIKLDLNNQGYCIIDDFFNKNEAKNINNLFVLESSWEKNDQIRDNHFSHVFKTKNILLPQPDEKYSAKYCRSFNLENSDPIKRILENYFKTFLIQISPFKINKFDLRCHKLGTGDHYRTHIDDYAGTINLIYYVNERWCWDWGGILNISSENESEFNKQIFPLYNRVVLLNNQNFRYPHFVSQVQEYALNPRYSIVIFTS
jgi:Rps23 Pro-64 3,4-dihydroxylase Tpa1-like proline 4-hydroxylase